MDIFISQILALVAFFAFPMIQYIILKCSVRRYGNPELWYLPAYGFRLVIRNLPSKRKLYDIKYRSFLRKIIPRTSGASVSTYIDSELTNTEDFFLFPGTDQVILAFRLGRDSEQNAFFIHTDKLGKEVSRSLLNDFELLIADYVATIDNLFHFDFKISQRVKISNKDLEKNLNTIEEDNKEQYLDSTEKINIT